ncbi:MAG: class I SAM-dependent methyltransferase [Candidatus Woesearchaeota archaeon]
MSDHYYSHEQQTPIEETTFSHVIAGKKLTITTATGLFSKEHVDTGSQLLLEYALLKPNWRVLDLGCGYGIVSLGVLCREPTCKVVASDITQRAVEYTQKNAQQNGLSLVVKKSDGLENVEQTFDTILLNPPQSAGKDVCERLIRQGYEQLVVGGIIQVVIRTKKGGSSMQTFLQSQFGNVRPIAKKGGFRILVAKKEKSHT